MEHPLPHDEYVIKNGAGEVVLVLVDCRCPRPRCVICLEPLDDVGRCAAWWCQHDGLPVPVPVIR